jgi:hypothetical protein
MSAGPSIVDVALRPDGDGGSWLLAVTFALGRGLLSDVLRLGLDPAMRAVPPPAQLDRTISLATTTTATLARVLPGIGVSENRRLVRFALPRRAFGLRTLTAEVHVEWANPLRRPLQVSFDARFTYLGFPVNHQTLQLLNLESSRGVRANILSVLANDDRRFYFPRRPGLIPMSYDDFSPLTASVQSLRGSTVWGTMWPTELSFWHSREGGEFLVGQLIRFRLTGARGRRIALVPDDPTITPSMRLAYLAELEVHHRHEVDVRLMEGPELRDELDEESDALLCLGEHIGVYYRGIDQPVSSASAGLLISQDGVHSMRDAYDDIQPRGRPWDESPLRTEVLSSAVARRYIAQRVRALGRLARGQGAVQRERSGT